MVNPVEINSSAATWPVGTNISHQHHTTAAAASASNGDAKSCMPTMQVDKSKMEVRLAIPLNRSPFDASRYEPLIPPPQPSMAGRPLLCLDLDETLIHAVSIRAKKPAYRTPRRNVDGCDLVFELPLRDGTFERYVVAFRPYLQEFIEFVSQRFEIVVFTASEKDYADTILQAIDPNRLLGEQRLYRHHCAVHDNKQRIKDLSLLGRPLERTVLLDNSATSFHFQPRNGIEIESWFGDDKSKQRKDTALRDVLPLLDVLSRTTNVVSALDLYHASR